MATTSTTSLFFYTPFNSQNSNKTFPKHRCSHPNFTSSSITAQSKNPAKEHLLSLISDQDRGIKTQDNPTKRASIITAIDELAALGAGSVTTGDSLSSTWRLLWTTEKEQLFIIEKAYLFGTKAGDVLQVIDVEKLSLNNVITFPPDGVFFVRSNIEVASSQRVNFRFTSAVLRGKNWEIPLPPFGQGCCSLCWRSEPIMIHSIFLLYMYIWIQTLQFLRLKLRIQKKFDTVYLDDDLRVVKDIRGDYLVVDRASYNWKE